MQSVKRSPGSVKGADDAFGGLGAAVCEQALIVESIAAPCSVAPDFRKLIPPTSTISVVTGLLSGKYCKQPIMLASLS